MGRLGGTNAGKQKNTPARRASNRFGGSLKTAAESAKNSRRATARRYI